jgi:peptide/nickel transport system ATP-binding protein/oligopeptide transport system ATP-binding protein
MYLGGVVEEGPTAEVFAHPRHPYTRALLSSAPVVEYGRVKDRLLLQGEIPSAIDLPTGCRLASRCPLVQESCRASLPPLSAITPTHLVACPVVSAVERTVEAVGT